MFARKGRIDAKIATDAGAAVSRTGASLREPFLNGMDTQSDALAEDVGVESETNVERVEDDSSFRFYYRCGESRAETGPTFRGPVDDVVDDGLPSDGRLEGGGDARESRGASDAAVPSEAFVDATTVTWTSIRASRSTAIVESGVHGEENDVTTYLPPQIFLSGANRASSKACHVSSKVQIVGGVAVPKQGALRTVSASTKAIHAGYAHSSDTSTMNSIVSVKPTINSSVLTQISNKTHPMGVPFVPFGARGQNCGPVQVKSSIVNSVSPHVKNVSASTNRSLTKINNNNNGIAKTDIPSVDQPGHVFSRVIPAPKISLQSTGRMVKSGSVQYGQKSLNNLESQQSSNIVQTHKMQTAMPVKIIQQQTLNQSHKTGFKTVQTSRTTIGTSKNLTYGSVNAFSGKSWSHSPSSNSNHVTNQKMNSAFAKNVANVVNVQKVNCKNPPQKVVVHQSTNPTQIIKANSQSYQSNESGNTLRCVQGYVGVENDNSSSQNITAQILQSLSQPKMLLSSVQHLSPTASKRPTISIRQVNFEEAIYAEKPFEQKRQIHGDPNTVLSTDDILGTEERPALSDDSLPYHYHSLQLVMLDHTYAVSPQTLSTNSVNGTNVTTSASSPVNNNNIVSSPASPTKSLPISVNTLTNNALSRQSPVSVITTIPPTNSGSCITQTTPSYQYNLMSQEDDDAASVISSIEGDRDIERNTERHDSDTETAPEGEEEGKTRCVCEFTHDDGYMICCDKCGEWQHVDCMGIDRQNIPDDYMCDRCEPRVIDRKRARSIQIRKREEQLASLGSSGSDSSSGTSVGNHRNKQLSLGNTLTSSHKKKLHTVTTYSNTISGVSRTVPVLPSFSPTYGVSSPPPVQNSKKIIKKPRRIDNARKLPKRKLQEKRKRKSGEVSNYRSKYCSSSSQMTQWTESFELAMTNHYSPELRAKMARYTSKSGNNSPNMASVLTAHLCTTVPHAGSKILIATDDMKENTPIIELRGKYMLSTQHKPQPQLSSRMGSQRPGPFLFFYRLPKDSTQICIDTRTYGNEARFVRRSCKPNAELQHCIIKGALHVYLVTVNSILSNTEITIRHDSTGVFQPCACGNPKHCKQTGTNNSVVHRNNGAANDATHERRGRTRYSSSSLNCPANSIMKYDDFLKSESPELEKSENKPEQPDLVKRNTLEKSVIEKLPGSVLENCESFIVDKKPILNASGELSSPDEPLIEKKICNDMIKDEFETTTVKEEKCDISSVLVPCDNNEKLNIKQEDINQQIDESECKSPTQCASKNSSSSIKSKENEKTAKKVGNSRRTSVHSTRSTRALTSTNTCESADEKSDTQNESKTQGSKEKKKLTREERKMEAIMKAFERMEKAELRRQENKDRQSKRRESDMHPPNIGDKDLKEQNDDDDGESSSLKRRRRKKGRARTASQSQRNRNRLNSIDSDMVTSGEESTSLLSPPISNNMMNNSFSENTPLTSVEDAYRSSILDSVGKPSVELSPVCLLVEAAVGPLESTFKFPKTKKDMMNEWLSKSPERNSSFDINHHNVDYSNTGNNINQSYDNKPPFLENKSIENIMRVTKSMIGTFSGGTISIDSTPEKNFNTECSESESFIYNNAVDSSGSISPTRLSPQSYSQRILTKQEQDNACELHSPNDKKVPKRFRKEYKSAYEESLITLRSSVGLEYNNDGVSCVTSTHDETNVVMPPADEIRDAEILSAPLPPQHSAKKRWLRQAISEESDSPTAESPPNEMVTPLKKRRLARESLSTEPAFGNGDEQYFSTPKKDADSHVQNLSFQESNFSQNNDVDLSNEVSTTTLKPDISENIKMDTLPEPPEIDSCKAHSNPDSEILNSNMLEEKAIIESPVKKDDGNIDCEKTSILSDLKFNFSQFSKSKGDLGRIDSKDDACLGNTVCDNQDLLSRDIKSEPVSNINSAETSGNSSPVLDDIDDIKKKIHSFHTENIQFLKIRNKKQPKEKRKKVNLNFDLCVLADQTIDVKLKSEKETINEDLCTLLDVGVKESMNKGFSESPLKTTELGRITPDKTSLDTLTSKRLGDSFSSSTSYLSDNSVTGENVGFKSVPLFSGSFKTEISTASHMPDINVIKSAIDLTTSLDIGFKCNNNIGSVDEYKNAQEILSHVDQMDSKILSHVNQMDSRSNLLLSGNLKDTNRPVTAEIVTTTSTPVNKVFVARSNDPRLNPPPVETPKPIRRKLSITEYRRRHSMVSNNSSGENETEAVNSCQNTNVANQECSSSLSSVSDDISIIVGKNIEDSIAIEARSVNKTCTDTSSNSSDANNENSSMEIDTGISSAETMSSQITNTNSVNIEITPKSIR